MKGYGHVFTFRPDTRISTLCPAPVCSLSLANLSCSPCFILTQESGRVLVANVGDSQAFLLRKGQALGLSTPHRVYGSGKGGDEGKSETARGSEASGFLASLWLRDAEREREREGESSSPPRPGLRLQSI